MDLLVTCLTYLCYDALGEDLDDDDEQLQKNLLSGRYRLQVYASSTWFLLVKKFAKMTRDEASLSTINVLTENLYSECENPNYNPDMKNNKGSHGVPYKTNQTLWKGASEFLYKTLRFHTGYSDDIWTSNNGTTGQFSSRPLSPWH